jgi:tetratricopeptide (TPR) repeat protein
VSILKLAYAAATVLLSQISVQTAQELYNLGSKHFNQRQFTDAKDCFNHAIQLDAGFTDAYRALGMTELELKQYDAAYHAWLKAVALNPKDEKSKYYLGRLFYEADFPNESAAWLRQALELAPNDYEAMTYLGLCAEALGFNDTALQLYRRAIAESRSQGKPYSWAFLSLGNYLKKRGDELQAITILEHGAAECPEAHELAALGELLSIHNQPQRAEEVLRHAIALDPALSQAHYRLALLLKGTGRAGESRAEMLEFQETKDQESKDSKVIAIRK